MTLLAFYDPHLAPSQHPDRSMRFLANLSPEAISDFDSLGRLSSLAKASVIFKEDDPSRSIIVLRNGEVKLSSTSNRGRTLILKVAHPGELLGLAAVMSASPHQMSAETLVPTLIKTIPATDFLHFIGRHGGVHMHTARLLAEDCRSAFLYMHNFAYFSAAERLASILLNWGQNASAPEPRLNFQMTLTHDELGSLAGVSRETVTRVLSGFQKRRLIEVHGASFFILEPARLATLIA